MNDNINQHRNDKLEISGHKPASDPLGLVPALAEALEDTALVEAEDRGGPLYAGPESQAALELAIALGKTRAFQCDPGDLDGELPVNVALAAATELTGMMEGLCVDAEKLEERCEASEDEFEEVHLAAELLEYTLDAWTALMAIEDAYEPIWLDEGADSERLRPLAKVLDECRDLSCRLDARLQACREALTMACETHLLENWRSMLTKRGEQMAPWWISGELEALAEQQRQIRSFTYARRRGELEALAEQQRQELVQQQSRKPAGIFRIVDFFGASPKLRAAAGSGRPAMPRVAKWQGPHGELAEIHVASEAPDDREVRLVFTDANGPITTMGGTPVSIGGVEGMIDEQGIARFTIGDLRAASRAELTLRVGDNEKYGKFNG